MSCCTIESAWQGHKGVHMRNPLPLLPLLFLLFSFVQFSFSPPSVSASSPLRLSQKRRRRKVAVVVFFPLVSSSFLPSFVLPPRSKLLVPPLDDPPADSLRGSFCSRHSLCSARSSLSLSLSLESLPLSSSNVGNRLIGLECFFFSFFFFGTRRRGPLLREAIGVGGSRYNSSVVGLRFFGFFQNLRG